MSNRVEPQINAVHRLKEKHGIGEHALPENTWLTVVDVVAPGTAGVGFSGEKTVLVSAKTGDETVRHLALPLGMFTLLTEEVHNAG